MRSPRLVAVLLASWVNVAMAQVFYPMPNLQYGTYTPDGKTFYAITGTLWQFTRAAISP
jgi:hypothetical protein